ncbi:DUF21 domain-containing protein At4g14240 [Physcomitrium patens]|uniref:CNNM transmembrane domain-containing protein n=1 Tax=Physcomitrium patens TaxID=3218 RepID=A0A2K1LAM9_PHYPA|nr:DUF21 domain-containing protein At4g14240-like isoform X1 [Physcomitrium patens]PNR63081.1 hypothetical protein PHYPA_001506 [Physcomitrium patens]|eukprot:XP_024371622.1 DUF21 domain-containing protein At4g14240-like isoform X1 [Physcomitrella patens]
MVVFGFLRLGHLLRSSMVGDDPSPYSQPWWWIWAGISLFLVLFAGVMSGLTLGLMSLGLVDLEVLQQSGTDEEREQASKIAPVVRKQHQLLVTLLLCNAAAMEALPIFLDDMFNEVVAVILSVTFVLAFGEVIPQAVCSRHGLAIGADLIWLVKILMTISWPVSYPVGKILDYLLGHNESALFRRAQLKALVSIHGREAGKGGELTHDETTIIQGALDLTEKTALDSMTPIESTFSLDVHSKLDWEALGKIIARGHSRVPVYDGNPRNLIGVLLVKSLLTVRAEAETPVSSVSIRRIPRVPSDMPLYDILNEFQKGGSHMAAVTKVKGNKRTSRGHDLNGIEKLEGSGMSREADVEKGVGNQTNANGNKQSEENVYDDYDDLMDGEVIGIITMEDVMEELLQEEIVDETDEYIDVHKKVRVAAAAATQVSKGSSILVRRAGSLRTPQMGLSKQGQHAVSKIWQVENLAREEQLATHGLNGDALTTPLLWNDSHK